MPRKRTLAQPDEIDLTGPDADDARGRTSPAGKKRRVPPASLAQPGVSPAGAGKSRTSKKAKEEEKRQRPDGTGVRWRSSPTTQIQTRIDRALCTGAGLAHRMYLIGTEQLAPVGSPGGARHQFAVMGTTGNVYDVVIGCHSTCTCPDRAQRSSICKHMLFVMLRVLRRATNDPLIWQEALLASEADELLANVGSNHHDQSILANARARQRYLQLSGKALEGAEEAAPEPSPAPAARSVDGEDCPICYEPMSSSGGEPNACCTQCRNCMHEACFKRWADQKRSARATVTCVYCRAPWLEAAGSSAGEGKGKYLNLASEQPQRPSHSQLYGRELWHNQRRSWEGAEYEDAED